MQKITPKTLKILLLCQSYAAAEQQNLCSHKNKEISKSCRAAQHYKTGTI